MDLVTPPFVLPSCLLFHSNLLFRILAGPVSHRNLGTPPHRYRHHCQLISFADRSSFPSKSSYSYYW